MRRVKLDEHGCSANLDHIVTVEKSALGVIARMLSGSTVKLAHEYPVAYDLFKVSINPEVWVNPVYVSIVDLGFNKDAAFRDIMADKNAKDKDYTQVQVETVLGEKHTVWSDIYGVDEVDYLADLLDRSADEYR